MSDTKLCKDCEHFRLPLLDRLLGGHIFGDCAAYYIDLHARTDPVDGTRRPASRYLKSAAIARFPTAPCGPEGKLWEARS